MKEHDARKITPETREHLRAISLRLRERQLSNRDIADILGGGMKSRRVGGGATIIRSLRLYFGRSLGAGAMEPIAR